MKTKGIIIRVILLILGVALIATGIVFINLAIAIGAIISIALGVSCLTICAILVLLIKKSL